MILTRTFPPEAFAEALESWTWLPIAGKQPVLATVFGDVFLHDADGYWFLDAAGGKLEKLASTKEELKAMLSSAEGQDRYLLAGLAEAAEAQGLRLQPSEVFNFTKPPVLGGQFEVGNLSPNLTLWWLSTSSARSTTRCGTFRLARRSRISRSVRRRKAPNSAESMPKAWGTAGNVLLLGGHWPLV